MKLKASQTLDRSGTAHPTARRRVANNLNPQAHRRQTLVISNELLLVRQSCETHNIHADGKTVSFIMSQRIVHTHVRSNHCASGNSHIPYLFELKCGQAQKQYLRILWRFHWFTFVIPWVSDRAGVSLPSFTAFACLVDGYIFIMEFGIHAGQNERLG